MSWTCTRCGAVVSDKSTVCTACSSAGSTATVTTPKVEYSATKPGSAVTGGGGDVGVERDAEGYTMAERMARRPTREIADSHLLAMQRERVRAARKASRRKAVRDPMPGAVHGTVKVSRPIFFRPFGMR